MHFNYDAIFYPFCFFSLLCFAPGLFFSVIWTAFFFSLGSSSISLHPCLFIPTQMLFLSSLINDKRWDNLLLWAKVCIVRLRFKNDIEIQFKVGYFALGMNIQQRIWLDPFNAFSYAWQFLENWYKISGSSSRCFHLALNLVFDCSSH